MYMNAAARGGGASIWPSLSTTCLDRSIVLRKQDVLMLTFMVNLVALSPHSQKSTSSRDVHAVPSSSIVDLALRCQAAKANSFAQVPSFRTPGCRSGVDFDDLGAKNDCEEMLAKKVKAWHRRRHAGPQTERVSQLSRAKTCAGSLAT